MINKKYFKLATIVIIALLCLYFYLFFQKGILFHNEFLVQDKKDNVIEYKGKINGRDIKITVLGDIMKTNSSTITYDLKDKYSYIYKVNITDNFQENRDIKILENNLPKFIGKYKPTNTIIALWELNGDPVIELDYHDDFLRVTNSHIAETAFKDNVIKRGNIGVLFYTIIISLILFLDIKWPLLFFQLSHSLSVEDPKPTDFYIVTQKISRVIGGISIIILLIFSLTTY